MRTSSATGPRAPSRPRASAAADRKSPPGPSSSSRRSAGPGARRTCCHRCSCGTRRDSCPRLPTGRRSHPRRSADRRRSRSAAPSVRAGPSCRPTRRGGSTSSHRWRSSCCSTCVSAWPGAEAVRVDVVEPVRRHAELSELAARRAGEARGRAGRALADPELCDVAGLADRPSPSAREVLAIGRPESAAVHRMGINPQFASAEVVAVAVAAGFLVSRRGRRRVEAPTRGRLRGGGVVRGGAPRGIFGGSGPRWMRRVDRGSGSGYAVGRCAPSSAPPCSPRSPPA